MYELKKIVIISRMRIYSILIQEAFLRKENKEKANYWGEQCKNYKELIEEIKNRHTSILDRKELAELAIEAYKANQAIEELRKITTLEIVIKGIRSLACLVKSQLLQGGKTLK